MESTLHLSVTGDIRNTDGKISMVSSIALYLAFTYLLLLCLFFKLSLDSISLALEETFTGIFIRLVYIYIFS